MRLYIEGPVNKYYVQTLCMIFFPGEKFGADAENFPGGPELSVIAEEQEEGAFCRASLTANGKTAEAEKFRPYGIGDTETREKTVKFAVGAAVLAAAAASLYPDIPTAQAALLHYE